jgi:PhzF family phenazine biosynthesis protein
MEPSVPRGRTTPTPTRMRSPEEGLMRIPIYHLDAFTSRVFGGNPAAVCPLEDWLEDGLLQAIAAENNLSETAFFKGGGGKYEIRWMTPTQEVDLCGHATLASAHVIFERVEPGRSEVTFASKSGPLGVKKEAGRLALEFPSRPPRTIEAPRGLGEILGREPREVLKARDLLAVFETPEDVLALTPDFARLASLDAFAVIATAPGRDVDFVSRFFAPGRGIPEDPVTGSSHCTLVPYWSKRLGKKRLHAHQLSKRGGELFLEDRGDRVLIAGHAVQYLEGTLEV